MRVVIIGKYPHQRTQIKGGVQAAFSYLVSGLSQFAELDLHILTVDSKSPHSYNLEQDNATVHFLPGLPRFEFIVRNYRTYQSLVNEALATIQPDIIHAQDAVQDAYVALRSGYPAVITVHGIRREDGKYLNNLMLRLRNRIHSTRIEGYNIRHTQHLIAISRYVTNYFANIIGSETNIYYIPNAINHHFFELENTGNGFNVLFMGRVIRRKRLLDLVKAFTQVVEHIPQAKLRVAGECSSDASYVESVRTYIQQAGLTENVSMLGSLPEDKVLEEFAQCDILGLSSIQETAPMVIAQAMAAGKPVVATAVGGVAEMVSDGQTGFLIDVGDVENLASNISHLLQNPSLRARMGSAGKEKAESNYRAEIVARHTYQVYKDIVAGI